MIASWRRREPLVLPGLLLLAAFLRLPDLATRGTWDADQGNEMLVLRAFVRDGVVPLVGPSTFIPGVHHGPFYYYLLAPAAALTGGDSPLAVVACIALAGIAAVGVTWWLARSIAGPIAGLVAGLAMAISPAAITGSTFIWNPNLVALPSAIALAGAWRALATRRPAWWIVAAVGMVLSMQIHATSVALLPIIGALLVADIRRRTAPSERHALIQVGIGCIAIIALSFMPLAIHELTTGFSDVQAGLAHLQPGGEAPALSPVPRFLVVASRILSWPLVGLITSSPMAALTVIAGLVAVTGWRFMAATGPERVAVRWLALSLAWSALALTFLTPTLGTVIEGLPNDHYHAFADPIVFLLFGVGVAALWRWTGPVVAAPLPMAAGRVLAVAGSIAVIAWAAMHQPPAVAPDGGFPAADRAAARIEADSPLDPIQLASLPSPKTAEAYQYPLVRDGRQAASVNLDRQAPIAGSTLVVVCDSLFESFMGAACGGPEEAAAVPAGYGQPIDRFKAAPRQTISVYRAPQGSAARQGPGPRRTARR